MVEDQTYLAIFDEIGKELQSNIVEYNGKVSGEIDKGRLIALRLEQNERLTELLRKHRRVMEFMQGKKVEPEIQFGETVLFPVVVG